MEGVDKKGPYRILWNKLTCPLVTPVTTRRSEVGGSSPTCRSHDKSATTVPDRLMLRTSHLELPNPTILGKKFKKWLFILMLFKLNQLQCSARINIWAEILKELKWCALVFVGCTWQDHPV
jgi:hypothetical protein